MKKQESYYPALTGLRAFAALLVFLHHYTMLVGPPAGIEGVSHEGYIGVSVFFTLSGFLITRIYMGGLLRREITFGQYWLRRFARVYPAYLFLLIVKYVGARFPPFPELLSNLTLTQSFFPAWLFSGIPPAWSLTIEECFYLSAPLVFLLLWRGKESRALGHPAVRTAVLLVLTTAAFWGLGFNLDTLFRGQALFGDPSILRIYNIFGRFGEFAFGIFVAVHFNTPMAAPTGSGGRATLKRWAPELGFIAFAISVVLSTRLLADLTVDGWAYGIQNPNGNFPLWVLSAGTAALIWATVNGSRLSQWILGNPVVEYLGRTSFAFYLLQDQFYTVPIVNALPRKNVVLMYIALNMVAAAVYHLVERPAHKRILRLWGKPSVRSVRLQADQRGPAKAGHYDRSEPVLP